MHNQLFSTSTENIRAKELREKLLYEQDNESYPIPPQLNRTKSRMEEE